MRNVAVFGILAAFAITACAKGGATPGPANAKSSPVASDAAIAATDNGGKEPADAKRYQANPNGAWIGASAEGEMMPMNTRETFLGVWVDVPEGRPEVRPPMEIALVVDTSGSMAGAKIENARAAATTLVKNLKDGDIVALDAFSDTARTIVPPTRLDANTRAEILRAIAQLTPSGSTNMFEGLTLGEGQVAAAPPSHPLRRVVIISDGIANVGPSSPESLGAIAERGLRNRAQVTSIGVGADYDERTLNALAVKSSGRLYHLNESNSKEMASLLKTELDLLDKTMASDAFVEVVAAPGVQIMNAEGVRMDWQEHGRSIRIPLGALHAGQHREALVRVRLTDPMAFEGHTRSLASVRLRFRDTQDSDVERIQEVVARTQLTNDNDLVTKNANSRTKAIVAIQDSARIQTQAAQSVNAGHFGDADKELEEAQKKLQQQAAVVTSAPEKKRLEDAANRVQAARRATAGAAAAPKPAQMEQGKALNASGMRDFGY
jgi:Ca-activated chloride channel homolog